MAYQRGVVVLLVVMLLGSSGCAAVLIGAGAAGGYALSKDSVKNQFDLPKGRVYKSSVAALKEMGQVTLQDSKSGVVEGKIGDADITITVKQLTEKTVELEVKARDKVLIPKVDVAQKVYNKIAERLQRRFFF